MMKNTDRSNHQSLQQRFVLSILLAALVSSVLFAAVTVSWQYRIRWRQVEAGFDEIQRTRIAGLSQALAAGQASSIQESLHRLVAESVMSRAMVSGVDGRIYAQAEGDALKENASGLEELLRVDPAVNIYPLVDLSDPSRSIGTLAVEYDRKPMVLDLIHLAIDTFLLRACQLLFLALLSIWIVQHLIMQHLRRIEGYLLQLAERGSTPDGLWLNRAIHDHDDEFDGIVTAVNQVAERMSQMREQLPSVPMPGELGLRDPTVASQLVKLATLGEMAGGIAHEINNPLHIIKGYNDILVEQLTKGVVDREALQRSALIIDKNVNRIARIVSSLLMFSHKGASEELEATSLAQLIDQVASITQPLAESHGIGFEVDLTELSDAAPLPCKPAQIAQVLLNMINNAIDAIAGQEPQPWIKVLGRSGPEQLSIQVIDSGYGIPEAIAAKMFEPFFTTKELGKGMGLGLSMGLGIVEQHGGKLYLDRQHQHTCFVLELPYDSARSRGLKRQATPPIAS